MADTLDGTNFNDELIQDDLIEVSIYGYAGDDDIYLNRTDSLGGFNFVDAGSGDDKVVNYFEGGNDIFLGSGDDLYIADIRAFDDSASDVVSGGLGNDRFEVDSDASTYKGDSGNDTFVSVGFNNLFNGGTGIDTISYAMQDDYKSQKGQGVDIDLAAGEAFINKNQIEDLVSIENATGTNSADDISGSAARNVLKGLDGADNLYGLAGNDDLFGGAGADDLYGGTGADDLTGGLGSDYLNGGAGADVFYFDDYRETKVGVSRDVIADFSAKQGDLIDLSLIDANTRVSGDQDFDFIGKDTFSKHAGELRLSNGVISGDINGDGRADFEIRVTGVTKMFADDFVL